MAVRTIDELMQSIKDRIGDSTNDEDISFIEDFSDSLQAFNESETTIRDLRTENESLRQKYRDRFFSGENSPSNNQNQEPDNNVPKTFEDLFKGV